MLKHSHKSHTPRNTKHRSKRPHRQSGTHTHQHPMKPHKQPFTTTTTTQTDILRKQLHEAPMDQDLFSPNPVQQFHNWFTDVCQVEPIMPERMTISTTRKITAFGVEQYQPAARPVLLKDIIIKDKMISPYRIIQQHEVRAQEGEQEGEQQQDNKNDNTTTTDALLDIKFPIHATKQWFTPQPYDKVHQNIVLSHVAGGDQSKTLPYTDVVLKNLLQTGGFAFVTNYTSDKAQQIEENQLASLTFHWVELERVVRVEGLITQVPHHLSTMYHHQRPYHSRISALTSHQSQPVEDYGALAERFTDIEKLVKHRDFVNPTVGFTSPDEIELALDPLNVETNEEFVPKPKNWGGYVIVPHQMEFWQGKPSRFHQRIRYTRQEGVVGEDGGAVWDMQYLQP